MLSPAHYLLLSAVIAGTCGVPHSRRGGFGGGPFGGPGTVPDYGDYYNYGFPVSGRGSFGGARGGGQPCPSGPTSSTPLTGQQVQDLTDAFFAATEDEQRLMLQDFLTSLGSGGSGASSNSAQFPDYGDYEGGNSGRGRGRGNGNRSGHSRG